jgi:hypothetical protein
MSKRFGLVNNQTTITRSLRRKSPETFNNLITHATPFRPTPCQTKHSEFIQHQSSVFSAEPQTRDTLSQKHSAADKKQYFRIIKRLAPFYHPSKLKLKKFLQLYPKNTGIRILLTKGFKTGFQDSAHSFNHQV